MTKHHRPNDLMLVVKSSSQPNNATTMFQQTAFVSAAMHSFDYLFESPQFWERKQKKGTFKPPCLRVFLLDSPLKKIKWAAFGDLWIFFFFVILLS